MGNEYITEETFLSTFPQFIEWQIFTIEEHNVSMLYYHSIRWSESEPTIQIKLVKTCLRSAEVTAPKNLSSHPAQKLPQSRARQSFWYYHGNRQNSFADWNSAVLIFKNKWFPLQEIEQIGGGGGGGVCVIHIVLRTSACNQHNKNCCSRHNFSFANSTIKSPNSSFQLRIGSPHPFFHLTASSHAAFSLWT